MKHSPIVWKICLMLGFLWTPQVMAKAQHRLCDAAALQAADIHGIPPQIMLAITRVETGREDGGALRPWPWAVNAAGQSHWFASYPEALAFVQDAATAGQSNLDIGCFQLNLHWHGAAFPSLEVMFDPTQNADYAAQFLLKNHVETGNWVDAVARYHSRTPEHATAYIEKVERVLAMMQADGPPAGQFVPAPEGVEAPTTRNNSYPLLQPGARAGLASIVPTAAALPPLFAATP